MLNTERDIEEAILTINGERCINGADKSIFYCANENVSQLLSNFDLSGKNVLSVLASGDQAYHLYDNHVDNIDLFDINQLAIYYYYLRIWCLKYLNHMYPPVRLDGDYILQLLFLVVPVNNDEKLAYDFWITLINKVGADKIKCLFRTFFHPYRNELKNTDLVREKVINSNVNFFHIDMANELLLEDKKYDAIYVSNIGEWINDSSKLEVYIDNLNRLLKDDGVVICSLLGCNDINTREKRIFQSTFDVFKLERGERGYPPGYYYTKK